MQEPRPEPTLGRRLAFLLIDGGHLRKALQKYYPNSSDEDLALIVERIITELQERLKVKLVRRGLHEGTYNGKPSFFHRLLSKPDGADIEIVPHEVRPSLTLTP